jgi:cyclopropane fatty-acyl-phospholipid synthase-like methyltransferase
MINEYFNIRDICRKGMLKYLSKAISILPEIPNPLILDVGCGTGIPTIALAEKYNSQIIAIDIDKDSIDMLNKKIDELNLRDKITAINKSLFDVGFKNEKFDLIIAEGFINTVGFEKGFLKLKTLVKGNGFLVIHDDHRNYEKKINFIENNDCDVVKYSRLDEKVWWNDYYKCLENVIQSTSNEEILKYFKSDIDEIKSYKQEPSRFNSMYYIVKKRNE